MYIEIYKINTPITLTRRDVVDNDIEAKVGNHIVLSSGHTYYKRVEDTACTEIDLNPEFVAKNKALFSLVAI